MCQIGDSGSATRGEVVAGDVLYDPADLIEGTLLTSPRAIGLLSSGRVRIGRLVQWIWFAVR